jgi:hypothetical protein
MAAAREVEKIRALSEKTFVATSTADASSQTPCPEQASVGV